LILYTYTVLVTVTAVLLGRDRLTPGRAAALVAASGGTLLVLLGAGGGSFHPARGVAGFRRRDHLHRLHPRRRHRRAPAAAGGAVRAGDDRGRRQPQRTRPTCRRR